MDIANFEHSLNAAGPPAGVSDLLRALWYDAKGDWNRAHELAQEVHDLDGARVHAYLHRKEGDLANADYWYRRARETRPDVSLQEEWAALVARFVGE
jgi:hypothetical protein